MGNSSIQKQAAILNDGIFLKFIQQTSKELLLQCQYIHIHCDELSILNRPLMGHFHLQATKLEEVLDGFGARNNSKWYEFRKAVAAAKLFSNTCYSLLHIKHASPFYRLLPIVQNFYGETDNAIRTVFQIICRISQKLLDIAKAYQIEPTIDSGRTAHFQEDLPPGRLPADRKIKKATKLGKTVVHLASAFLRHSEKSKLLAIHRQTKRKEYPECMDNLITEESLRRIEQNFHNLQSLYDTHISDTNIETIDTNLSIMRGHISLIFHLMEVATDLCHYYERHMNAKKIFLKKSKNPFFSQNELLGLLIDYAMGFADWYRLAAQDLCRTMISQYAENGKIEVSVPNYRGFHVRPSTLVSKIVLHYGSEVFLELDGQQYDASSPLELFRVNESINAKKRKEIADYISNLSVMKKLEDVKDLSMTMRIVFFALMEEHKIIVYERDFCVSNLEPIEGEALTEYCKRGIAQCMAHGKIDIEIGMKVQFIGDKRVLQDIKLLAEHGYGEDDHGNNIMLPKELSYLR